ncbi:MAG: hypothetical protein AUJ20_12945 [Comamonadaceae bacterium CG1_02_60_18]|nr:MAG: hypothetical protein AUJ20_12945 [Comamonadaceae bacterium CG1_02_60_18]
MAALEAARAAHYLFFHTMAELLAIVMSFSIFVLAWLSNRYLASGYLVVLGASYLAVGVVDVFHTLTFRGMNLFPGVDTNYPTQFWLTARFMEALALLLAPMFVARKPNFAVVAAGFAVIAAAAGMAVMHQWFPATFIDGVGLTGFKIYSEYIIIAMLLAGFVLLLRCQNRFEPRIYFLLLASIVLAIVTEICFTRYVSFYDFTNELGHYSRFLSSAFAFMAIVLSGVRQPLELIFRELEQNKNGLESLNNQLGETAVQLKRAQAVAKLGSWHLDVATGALSWSDETYRLFGVALGTPQSFDSFAAYIHPADRDAVFAAWELALAGQPYDIEHRILVGEQVIWVRELAQLTFAADGTALKALGTVQDITERKDAEDLLLESEAFSTSVFNSVVESIAVLDAQGIIIAVNEPWRKFALDNGAAADAHGFVGQSYLATCAGATGQGCGDEAEAVAAGIRSVMDGKSQEFHLEYPCHSPDQKRWFHLEVRPFSGPQRGVLVAHTNITAAKLAQAALRDSQARMSAVFQASPIGIVISRISDGKILEVNDACLRLYRYTRSEVLGCTVAELGTYAQPKQRAELLQVLRENGFVERFLVQFRKHDGAVGVIETSARIIELDGVACMLAMLSDVTEREHSQRLIHEQALHDALTRLPNRRLLGNRLQQAVIAAKRSGCYAALLYLDLDNFKPLNDTQGHDVGDLLLVEGAARLSSCVREVDTVARIGGDEFVVMLCELSANLAESTAQAAGVAEKIRSALAAPYVLRVQRVGQADNTLKHQCSASIGVVLFVNDQIGQDDILNRADVAMYQAKRAGRNRIHFYTPGKTE